MFLTRSTPMSIKIITSSRINEISFNVFFSRGNCLVVIWLPCYCNLATDAMKNSSKHSNTSSSFQSLVETNSVVNGSILRLPLADKSFKFYRLANNIYDNMRWQISEEDPRMCGSTGLNLCILGFPLCLRVIGTGLLLACGFAIYCTDKIIN